MKGRIQVYKRDHINTDEIIPARYLNCNDEKKLAKHIMEGLEAIKGDFIIAGWNFGCGSSREHAIWALRGAGVRGVIAKSFSRIFYRNAINNGFLVLNCPEIDDNLKTGEEIEINLKKGYFTIKGKRYHFSPFPPFLKKILDKGGLLNTL